MSLQSTEARPLHTPRHRDIKHPEASETGTQIQPVRQHGCTRRDARIRRGFIDCMRTAVTSILGGQDSLRIGSGSSEIEPSRMEI